MSDSGAAFIIGLAQLPALLVSLGAIVVAAVRWTKHPLASLLVATGAGIGLVARAVAMVLPRIVSPGSMSWVFAAQGLIGTLGFAMVVAAVFVDRERAGAQPPRPMP
jgi:hypothetical protein